MKRNISGLNHASSSNANGLIDGLFLVRVARVHYHWHTQKPFFVLHFFVLEPEPFANRSIIGRLYCTPKTLWKLNWFLRDFGYDNELLERDEIDDKHLIGLCGVVQITHTVINGTSLLNLEGFAPASKWEELSAGVENLLRRMKVES